MKASSNVPTAALVEQARDPTMSLGDQQAAFAQLVQRSQHVVFALALSYLRDGDDAKDATQDAFVMAWRCLSKLRDPGAFEPWLKSIVAFLPPSQRRDVKPFEGMSWRQKTRT